MRASHEYSKTLSTRIKILYAVMYEIIALNSFKRHLGIHKISFFQFGFR